MPIVRITRPGLGAIALCVALLWGCFIGERLMVRDAHAQRAHLMRELQQLQRERRTEPVSVPAPAGPQPVRVTVG